MVSQSLDGAKPQRNLFRRWFNWQNRVCRREMEVAKADVRTKDEVAAQIHSPKGKDLIGAK